MEEDVEIAYELNTNRAAWVHVVRGDVTLNGISLGTGDGAAVTSEKQLTLTGKDVESSEILLFDLA